MRRISVCLETVFTDLSYEDRIRRIAAIGCKAVEFWHSEATWDGKRINDRMPKDAAVLRDVCREAEVKLVGFAVNGWDGLYGGCPVKAEDRGRFLEQVHRMLDFASVAGCTSGIIMPGLLQPGVSRTAMRDNMQRAFSEALTLAEKRGFTLLVEPLNTLVDHRGFFLDSAAEAAEIVRGLKSPFAKMLYDVYHMQIMSGNVVDTIRSIVDIIGHMHVAGVPGRAEPDRCELDYPFIFRSAEELGYKGWFGLEYFPKLPSEESLRRQIGVLGTSSPE